MSSRAGATVLEVKGSHAVYVSQPRAVANLIEKAAKGAFGARMVFPDSREDTIRTSYNVPS